MIEVLVLGALGFAAMLVIGVLSAGLSLIFLPFRILGWCLRGVALLLALPFMALFGFIGMMVFGVGMLIFMLPFLPLALLAYLIWRAMRRPPQPARIST